MLKEVGKAERQQLGVETKVHAGEIDVNGLIPILAICGFFGCDDMLSRKSVPRFAFKAPIVFGSIATPLTDTLSPPTVDSVPQVPRLRGHHMPQQLLLLQL